MRASLSVVCIALLSAAGCASAPATVEGPMEMAAGGVSRARIVTAKPGAHAVAVQDLQRVLYCMTGAVIPICDGSPEKGDIFVGTASEALKGGATVQVPALENEEVFVKLSGGCLYLLGGESAGASHAVYTWLNEIGCRWFVPGEIGEHIPKSPVLVIQPVSIRHKPSFAMRTIWYAYGANSPDCGKRFGEWARRNCQGAFPRVAHGHNFDGFLPKEKYFAEHPEYFALVDGRRDPTQICTSNPKVIEIAVQKIIETFDADPNGQHTYSLCPSDSNDFCECPNCAALDVGKPDPFDKEGKKPWVTDRLMVFWNAVAERVAAKHPDAVLGFYCYVSHTAPPEREKIHPNLAPVFTAQQFCVMHSVGDAWCESRQTMKKMLETYCAMNRNVNIYDYDPPPGNNDLPIPLYAVHARDLPIFKKMGIRGFSWECHDSWAAESPNYWINAQLQWDVGRDYAALMNSYLNDFFGPAAAVPMKRYYDALESCFMQQDVHSGWGAGGLGKLYREDAMKAMRQAVNEALGLAEGVHLRRVQMVDMGLHYLEAYRVLGTVEEHQDYGAAEDAVAQVKNVLGLMYATNEDYMIAREPAEWLRRYTADMRHYLPESKWFKKGNDVWAKMPKEKWRVSFEEESGQPSPDWAKQGFDDSKWHLLDPNVMWYRQVEPKHKGNAWGRCEFEAPEKCQGRKTLLYVGALDERGSIFLNGQLVHIRTGLEDPSAWTTPFTVDVTGKVLPGKTNILAVSAMADTTIGGVWRPVWLYSPK